ncbi:serine-type carboxypeptidase F [Talaromyces proteolyticus]|uniref:Carboxypeptidase n=1 Tax=Talaromyces proteolyticus TaxID=1131652 RepID=A0AAD4PZ45_9EURO|nr:serine-type carboxypeptidase F [Talaromyces proteolyticus]KAH8696037.1 serine-type carboxypeptidase F [Talaromyces proteolyticus]
MTLLSLIVAAAFVSNSHATTSKSNPVVSEVDKPKEFQFLSNVTEKFFVNGTNFPLVPFDIGESYAGLLPNTPHGDSKLFFWFFPSLNPTAKNEITIWLQGGPGCSSLDGLLQENGPFLWQSGTYQPVRIMYSWNNLTNIVYIDQHVGTGLSPGKSMVNNEVDISNQFNDFWRRFIDIFDMQGYKVYITGESYAGMYIPYIAEGFINKNDTEHFNLKGIQINDPTINELNVLANAVATLNHFSSIFSLNETFMKDINARDEKCGLTKFLNEALTYPPPKNFPATPNPWSDPDCLVWYDITAAAQLVNPCFNMYHLTDFCPFLLDPMGFPSLAAGPGIYFNRSDVQKALHVPSTNYSLCDETVIFSNGDRSVPSALGPLPKVIEATNNVIIGHGWFDFLFFLNGTLATIQNMTWNGAQGFQYPPTEPLIVPYTQGQVDPNTWDGGSGVLGTAHTERGLTFSSVYRSGHEIPQYAPGAAYRQLELLLGRIKSLQDTGPFTTQQ